MAGQPKKQAIIRELTNRARAEIDDSAGPIDYAVMWVESGKTLAALAADITRVSGLTIEREQVSRVLNTITDDAAERLARARVRGGHAMVETTLEQTEALADRVREENAQVATQRELNSQRWRLAGVWNPELREQRGANVSITLNNLHLDALRVPGVSAKVIANPLQPEPIDVEVIEAPRLAQPISGKGGSEVSGQ